MPCSHNNYVKDSYSDADGIHFVHRTGVQASREYTRGMQAWPITAIGAKFAMNLQLDLCYCCGTFGLLYISFLDPLRVLIIL